MRAYHFCASSLDSKWGFGDGDMLNEFVDDHAKLPITGRCWSSTPLLVACVERFLLPAIPRKLKLDVFGGTSHNPIRIAEGETLEGVDHIEVQVPEADIEQLFEELKQKGTWS